MADLTTPEGIEAELAATARYDVDDDLDLAKRRVAALRRKLDFAQSASADDNSYTFGTAAGEPLNIESAAGRFHGSLAIRTDLVDQLGGWIDTRRVDFDQQQIAACQDLAGDPGRPDAELPPSYIFRWGDTGESHCQGLMTGPANEDWYERNVSAHFNRY
ncbi:MAG: hypothetical protein QGF59_04885 [Pirellulaceae bacterium]|jgi:hypothetical protein|nr:hypothetical protein [Pirellulaceae bacterium]